MRDLDLLPGDVLVVRTSGFVGWAIMLGTRSRWSHAGIYVGGGKIMEARTTGAGLAPVEKYADVPKRWLRWGMSGEQRAAVVERARRFEGVPYGWADVAAMGLSCLGVRGGWVRRVLRGRGTVFCSQLVAVALLAGGVEPPEDSPSEVTPGDLPDWADGVPLPRGY